MASESEPKEVYLEADKEIPGQHYVCLSFISPQKVLKNKDIYFFNQFLKDYEIQYKIKATESFVMNEVKKVQDAASQVQDVLENLVIKSGKETVSVEDLSGALHAVKEMRATLTRNTVADLEAHVKANMTDFKETKLVDEYETFVFKNKKKMEDDFFAMNSFRTTIQGIKVRGAYDTYNEALARAKTLQKLDPSFNVYVGQVGFWLPWDPEPHDVAEQEYADDQLNQLMKKYKENESQRDEFYSKIKNEKVTSAKVTGTSAGNAAFGVSGATTEAPPSNMFSGEDLAIARKRELAAATAAAGNTIVHSK